jgi:hypothetical protein
MLQPMTAPHFGSERPGPASETRQLVESGRTTPAGHVSGRVFWIALSVIVVGIVLFGLALRLW